MLLTWEPPSRGHIALATIVKQVGSVSEVLYIGCLGRASRGRGRNSGQGLDQQRGRAGQGQGQ